MLTPALYVTTPGGPGAAAGVWDRAEIETYLNIQFQNGPVATVGVNGVGLQDVLKVLIDHERRLQSVEPHRSRSLCIQMLEQASHWDRDRAEALQQRTRVS
jgi:hypothetical protein